MARLSFLLYTLGRYAAGQSTNCPHCASPDTTALARKRLVLQLRRCNACGLMFRYPKADHSKSVEYYQTAYRDPNVARLPDANTVRDLIARGFADGNLDFMDNIEHIRAAGGAGRLLDFGCSWGYGVWQFRRAGFAARGFEISRHRARFGRELLDVDIIDLPDDLAGLEDGSFDVIHTSHVLEHLPDLAASLRLLRRLLRAGGLLAIYVPNCAGASAQRLGTAWGGSISEEHVLAFDPAFFARNLPSYGFDSLLFNSAPFDRPAAQFVDAQAGKMLAGDELLVLAR